MLRDNHAQRARIATTGAVVFAIMLSLGTIFCNTSSDVLENSFVQPIIAPDGGWPENAGDIWTKCNIPKPATTVYPQYFGNKDDDELICKLKGFEPDMCAAVFTSCLEDNTGCFYTVCINKNAVCQNDHACCGARHEATHIKQIEKLVAWCKQNRPNDSLDKCVKCNDKFCTNTMEAEAYQTGCGCEQTDYNGPTKWGSGGIASIGSGRQNTCENYADVCALTRLVPPTNNDPSCAGLLVSDCSTALANPTSSNPPCRCADTTLPKPPGNQYDCLTFGGTVCKARSGGGSGQSMCCVDNNGPCKTAADCCSNECFADVCVPA